MNGEKGRTPRFRGAVGIAGLGLIGGSLARRLVGRGVPVAAWNHRPHPYAQAEADGIRCEQDLPGLVRRTVALAGDGEVVLVLCTPLKAMPETLAALAPALGECAQVTLTDVGSVKGMVRAQVARAGLSDRYVGAHPMAGNERSGWQAADPGLYDGALWAVTVDGATDYRRFLAVARLVVEGAGNGLIGLDDATHDRAAALISHMPHVVSTALINELTASPDRNIAAALAAGCWRDMTRVALTDPARTRAMVEEDAANVGLLLRQMADRLLAVAEILDGGDGMGLEEFFEAGQPFRDYRAAVKAGAGTQDGNAGEERGTLELPDVGWQRTLLDSARRGERVTGFDTPRRARIVRGASL